MWSQRRLTFADTSLIGMLKEEKDDGCESSYRPLNKYVMTYLCQKELMRAA